MRYKFEKIVIDPILNIIKDNQDYLTEPENLPQLAKLGFIYNTLWDAGRLCLGYEGILQDPSLKKQINEDESEELWEYASCEDNPKYKLEMCEPKYSEIGDLIYDAWGMHVTYRDEIESQYDHQRFCDLIRNGKIYNETEKKLVKKNKTFNEWVEILTHQDYKYNMLYPNRKSVADNLLCGFGNGYGLQNGYIISEASGADQDRAIYGEWENAKFREDINNQIENLLNIPEVKIILDTSAKFYIDRIEEKLKEEAESYEHAYKTLIKQGKYSPEEGKLSLVELNRRLFSSIKSKNPENGSFVDKHYKEQYKYNQINEYSTLYQIYEYGEAHQSYIDAGIEICKDILKNIESQYVTNVLFATNFLKKYETSTAI